MHGLTARFTKDAEWFESLAAKAEATGKKVRGYTATEAREMAEDRRNLAAMTPDEYLAEVDARMEAVRQRVAARRAAP
jgi:hypothetical protein